MNQIDPRAYAQNVYATNAYARPAPQAWAPPAPFAHPQGAFAPAGDLGAQREEYRGSFWSALGYFAVGAAAFVGAIGYNAFAVLAGQPTYLVLLLVGLIGGPASFVFGLHRYKQKTLVFDRGIRVERLFGAPTVVPYADVRDVRIELHIQRNQNGGSSRTELLFVDRHCGPSIKLADMKNTGALANSIRRGAGLCPMATFG